MALIPEDVQIIELAAESIEREETVRAGASDFLVDFANGRWTSQLVTGADKAVQWLGIGCKTDRDRYPIYGDFGIDFEEMIASDLPRDVAEGEIIRSIEEMAEQHEEIRSVETDVSFRGRKAVVTILVNGEQRNVVIL